MSGAESMSRRAFVAWLLAVAACALALRLAFPTADPPWRATVGVVWHDEGAWVHNARNRALFGAWVQDAWNPMYVAPVFTALEYASFAVFGVGVWQARLVSELMGLASVLLVAFGVARLAGRVAGVFAGALLATNYVYLMYNRAALMEATMVALMVASWYGYVRAQESARWGALAAACALLAYFSKAAAAFFVVALAVEALAALWLRDAGNERARTAARATLAGLAGCGLIALFVFVIPNWTEYRFYNWQMSVTRKPSYDLASLRDRITWFPIAHDIFTRMWFVVFVGGIGALGWLARFRRLTGPHRLLLLWIALGATELILHDVGNERRFIFFIPPLVAVSAVVLGRDRTLVGQEVGGLSRRQALLALPIVIFALYVLAGALVRLAFIYEIGPGVRWSAATALVCTVLLYATWPAAPKLLAERGWGVRDAALLCALVAAGQIAQFGQWAAGRTYKNYQASVALGKHLPTGTLVHGKLANGLSLENRIRPIFVGRGFGNYEDRKVRDDVRYILTYIYPRVGYEGPVIEDVLQAYPNRRIIVTFDVAETTTGNDRAALIDKFGGVAGPGGGIGRARD
ncbi:MAG TPA: glycosyltransferase family 39 protein [Vicinamibacterales bacterium]|nr:glycosyltransferase family 39 protein [Vicinamibacterales bacterium]